MNNRDNNCPTTSGEPGKAPARRARMAANDGTVTAKLASCAQWEAAGSEIKAKIYLCCKVQGGYNDIISRHLVVFLSFIGIDRRKLLRATPHLGPQHTAHLLDHVGGL